MKSFRKILFSALVLFTPAKIFACAACYGGNIDSPMADGMNWAILTLGVFIVTVLAAFGAFLFYAIRRSAALTAAAEKNFPEASKI